MPASKCNGEMKASCSSSSVNEISATRRASSHPLSILFRSSAISSSLSGRASPRARSVEHHALDVVVVEFADGLAECDQNGVGDVHDANTTSNGGFS